MVGIVCGGSSARGSAPGVWGDWRGSMSFTASPRGVIAPSRSMFPQASSSATRLPGASSYRGVQAQTSQKWFRNEPPKAAWKKRSAKV